MFSARTEDNLLVGRARYHAPLLRDRRRVPRVALRLKHFGFGFGFILILVDILLVVILPLAVDSVQHRLLSPVKVNKRTFSGLRLHTHFDFLARRLTPHVCFLLIARQIGRQKTQIQLRYQSLYLLESLLRSCISHNLCNIVVAIF